MQRVTPAIVSTFVSFCFVASAVGQEKGAPLHPFIAKHCAECHTGPKPKGEMRLDQLDADFARPANQVKWQAVLERVSSGEMPPEDKPRPPEKDAKAFTAWISEQMTAAAKKRAAEGRVVLRRLNRV